MQHALTLEAENKFINIKGRNETFDSFIQRELKALSSLVNSEEITDKLIRFSKVYMNYSSDTESTRRRNVIDTRKYIYFLSKNYSTPQKVNPPKLNFAQPSSSKTLDSKSKKEDITLNSSLLDINGIGNKISSCLSAIGIFCVRDLLLRYPRDYVDYSSLKRIAFLEVGETATIVAFVKRSNAFRSPNNPNLAILELHLQDITGRIKLTRFLAGRRFTNRAYLHKQASYYQVGSTVAVSGLVKEGKYGKTFTDPIIEVLESSSSNIKSKVIGRLIPIYSLSEGLKGDRYRKIIEDVLHLVHSWPEPLNKNQLDRLSLMPIQEALFQIHMPKDQNSMKKARRRLVFDEFLFLQLGLLRRRNQIKFRTAPSLKTIACENALPTLFLKLLPFHLTTSQLKVIQEVKDDIAMPQPMARLIQGDVGSGKTIIAISALLHAVEAGWQGAFMAPTEVLAQQHYRNLCRYLPHLHVTIEILTGSTTTTRRKQILDDLSSGSLQIIVGTHALIQEKVTFQRLGLVVVDEQHRFGVRQRDILLNKGLQPHLLTMTATPIPRTLALSIHGDLDVSQITELPPGRTEIKTVLVQNSKRDSAYSLIRQHALNGQQVYFVLPLVEESEKLDLRSAIDVHAELANNVFTDLSVGLLHGRMTSTEKESVIASFLSGEIQILVSTTVIEVGVDVPNATLMVIDHADRFGLAQLHQLRGRVGRGSKSSECVLIDSGRTPESRKKLNYLVDSNDGFSIAETDLRLRGPGQVLGTRQSGLPDFALASLINDSEVLELAREEATKILQQDPNLKNNYLLGKMLKEHWNRLISNGQLN